MTNNQYNPHLHHRRSIRLKGYDYSQRGAYFITLCLQDRACLFGRVVNGQMMLNNAGTMIDKWWQKIPEKFPDIELGEYMVMPNHFHAVVLNTGATASVGANPRVRPQIPRVRPNDVGDTDDGNVNLDTGVNPTMIAETGLGIGMDDIGDADIGQGLRGGASIGRPRGAAPTVGGSGEILGGHVGSGEPAYQDDHTGSGEPAYQDDHTGSGEHVILGEHVGSGEILGEHVGSPLHRVVGWFKTMTTNEYIRGVKTLGWPRFNGKLWQRNYYEHIIRNERSYINISNYIINNPAKWDADKFYIDPSSPPPP